MIIQRVVKGISEISQSQARSVLMSGIVCNWWRFVNPLPRAEVPFRLTERNLSWHQNRYMDADPTEGGEEFWRHTPFISTTAGAVERDAVLATNTLIPAWEIALRFATKNWTTDGYLFYCYVLVSGRQTVAHEAFSEEIRELNIYTGFSLFQPEGEIAAKILIPPTQIERAEFWSLADIVDSVNKGVLPTATDVMVNPLFVNPNRYSNIRDVLL
jgi:hypothetical protein